MVSVDSHSYKELDDTLLCTLTPQHHTLRMSHPSPETLEGPESLGKEALGITEEMHGQKFIIEIARCFLAFGAPAHHLEAQLNKASNTLGVKAEFLLLPNTVFASFYDEQCGTDAASGLHTIKRMGGLSVSQLRATHAIYKRVMSLTDTPEQGWKALLTVQRSRPPYRESTRVVIAFLCGAVITCLAFGGSFLDAMIAGVAQGSLALLNFKMIGCAEPIMARIFEYASLTCSTIQNDTHRVHLQIICCLFDLMHC